MALFSRRPKTTEADAAGDAPRPVSSGLGVDADAQAAASDSEGAEAREPAPHVNISVSTFRGIGAGAPPAVSAPPSVSAVAATASAAPAAAPALPPAARVQGPAEAPPPRESVPGLKDNVLLHAALAKLSEKATAPELLDVARQMLQNHVFLRVRGDARALLSEGKELPLAVAKRGDDQFMLVYSSGTALHAAVQADGQSDTSAVAQPALAVLRHMLAGPYAGILIDGASAPARALLPRAVLEPAVRQADPQLRIKTLLAAERTAGTATAVAQALTEAPLWVAVREAPGVEEGQAPRRGIAEARTADGKRLLEVYSHALEVAAMGRGDRAQPFPAAQLGKALRDHPDLAGVLVDGAGPWIVLERDALTPVLDLPDPAAPTPSPA